MADGRLDPAERHLREAEDHVRRQETLLEILKRDNHPPWRGEGLESPGHPPGIPARLGRQHLQQEQEQEQVGRERTEA